MHLPQLIPAFQHYHWVLKTCHAGAELDTALNCAQGFLDGDLRCKAVLLTGMRVCRGWVVLASRVGTPYRACTCVAAWSIASVLSVPWAPYHYVSWLPGRASGPGFKPNYLSLVLLQVASV